MSGYIFLSHVFARGNGDLCLVLNGCKLSPSLRERSLFIILFVSSLCHSTRKILKILGFGKVLIDAGKTNIGYGVEGL
jgi:hypothetical protein